ncbi:MAG: hypothetical protein KatS3mg030_603 [Saprospiraceae bacterium]|nr:MAG: hypothetical protein KatS3mg030_603 [Saprospiraceae bacterium]
MKRIRFVPNDAGYCVPTRRFSPYFLTVLLSCVVLPLGIRAQFNFEECEQYSPPSPPTEGITLCQQQGYFTPDIVIGTSQYSVSLASQQLPIQSQVVSNLDIHINGKLVVDQSFSFMNCNIRFGEAAQIEIVQGVYLGSFGSDFFSCDKMWKGITAKYGCMGISFWYSNIEDAEFAFTIAEGVPINMVNNRFNRNWVSIRNGDANSSIPGLVFKYFWNNEFTFDAPLNPPYVLQPNYSIFPYAGIWLQNTAASIGLPYWSNTFSNMMHGMVLESCDVKVSRCHFENMTFDGGGGIGILATKGTLAAWGYGEVFHQNEIAGIETHGTNLLVDGYVFTGRHSTCINSVDNTGSEYVIIRNDSMHVLANQNTTIGINLERSVASGNAIHNHIYKNAILLTDTQIAIGINVVGHYPAKDVMVIDSNRIHLRNYASDMQGIKVAHVISENNRILGNVIDAPEGGTGNERYGIFTKLESGVGNQIIGNTVYGSPDNTYDGRIQCCIHVTDSPGMFICSNTTEDAARGFHFLNDCDGSSFASNRMNTSVRGLFIQGARIGEQFRKANIWSTSIGAFLAYAAELEPDPQDPTTGSNFSRFLIHSPQPQFFPSNIYPPMGWFQLNEGAARNCFNNSFEGMLTEGEQQLVSGSLNLSGLSAADVWDLERRMLVKLMQNPELMPAGSDAETFFNARIGTVMYQLASVEQDWKQAMLPGAADQAAIDNYQNSIFGLLDQLAAIDANTPQPASFQEALDSLQVGARAAVLSQLRSTRNSLDAVLAGMYAQRTADLGAVQSTLDGINTNTVYETNRKQLFQMLSDWGAGQEPDSADLAFVRSLAAQCPSEGGDAVEYARNLLPVCEQGQYLSDDPSEPCNRSFSGTEIESAGKVVIHPNPTTSLLQVDFPAATSGTLRLLSISGVELRSWQVTENRRATLHLDELPAGLYLLQVPTTEGALEVHKVVIER